ncbi:MAG TPA: helix-turn-helix transcriptional regulator [Sphingomicrobium sp.]|jgi:transcriptional regulator with XRE-family HTH domain
MRNILPALGARLRRVREQRGLTQAELAQRIGRDPARVSEFERELGYNRLGRDRLTLLADMCDALDLVPLLVPSARAEGIRAMIEDSAPPSPAGRAARAFDDLFVDLGGEEDER